MLATATRWYGCCAACEGEPQEVRHDVADVGTLQDEPIFPVHQGREPHESCPPSLLVSGARFDRSPRRALFGDEVRKGSSGKLAEPLMRTPKGLWPGTNSEVAALNEVLALRSVMRQFLRDLMRGKSYLVVMENSTESCTMSLAPSLLCLHLRMRGKVHDIPVKTIKDIRPGELSDDGFTPAFVDALCSTLVLQNRECVTFRFDTLQERDEFTKCIRAIFTSIDY